jgi:tRNA threonylcarbamoyl adenosine modification protein YjeE
MRIEEVPPHKAAEVVVTIPVADEASLAAVAARLVAVLPPTAFVALSGDLGAGKTTLVKCVGAAAGLDPAEIVSPTFGLIHQHVLPGRGTAIDHPRRIIHADMYRLHGVSDLAETGWDDSIAGECWVFVEWPERIAAALPADRIDLAIDIDSPSARTLTFTARGPIHALVVAALAGT